MLSNGMTREQAALYTTPLVLRSGSAGHVVPSRSDPTFNQVLAFIQNPAAAAAAAEQPTGAGVASTAAPTTAKGGAGSSDAGKGDGKGDGKDAGKGGWEQQADGSWVNTATGESYGDSKDTGADKDTDADKGSYGGKGDGKDSDVTKAPATKAPATKAPATKAPPACTNDAAWRQARGNKGRVYNRRSCDWVAKRANKRCSRNGLSGVSAFAACPKACGTCPA